MLSAFGLEQLLTTIELLKILRNINKIQIKSILMVSNKSINKKPMLEKRQKMVLNTTLWKINMSIAEILRRAQVMTLLDQ